MTYLSGQVSSKQRTPQVHGEPASIRSLPSPRMSVQSLSLSVQQAAFVMPTGIIGRPGPLKVPSRLTMLPGLSGGAPCLPLSSVPMGTCPAFAARCGAGPELLFGFSGGREHYWCLLIALLESCDCGRMWCSTPKKDTVSLFSPTLCTLNSKGWLTVWLKTEQVGWSWGSWWSFPVKDGLIWWEACAGEGEAPGAPLPPRRPSENRPPAPLMVSPALGTPCLLCCACLYVLHRCSLPASPTEPKGLISPQMLE